MKTRLAHLLLALAIVAGALGIVGSVAPAPASASCVIAQGNLQWVVNGYKGSMSASGCGTVDLISCVQNTAGTVYGCREWYGSGASVVEWSYNAASYYGCTQRARGYSNIYGWWVGAWVRIC